MIAETKKSIDHENGGLDKIAVLVMGMHRSGTSMLTGILHELGCKGPATPLPGNSGNSKGYFESEPIMRLNNMVLVAAKSCWNDWKPLGNEWHLSPRFDRYRAEAVKLLRSEYGDGAMIYLKDPRMCRLLPFWRQVLEQEGYRLVCIHTHRHPGDVSASLSLRKTVEVPPSIGGLVWFDHIIEAEAASRDLPRIFTSYAALLSDWIAFARRAEEVLGFAWPVSLEDARPGVARLVDPGLQHHATDTEAFLNDETAPEQFRKALQILTDWVRDGEDAEGRRSMDQLRHDFTRLVGLLHAPVEALKAALNEKGLLSAKLDEAEGKLDLTRITVEEAESRADAIAAELAATQAQIETLNAAQIAERALTEEREKRLTQEVAMWVDRLIERDRGLHRMRQDLHRMRHDLDMVRHKQAAQIQQVQKEHHRLIDEVHGTYRASTSWKVSAPLRFIGRMLRRQG